jgi:flagellar hook-basal body complex protein FliE
MESVIDTSRNAETQAKQAISGTGNLTDVATAVAKAELALQTTVALRDRVVQAYQEIMRMPI